MPCYLTKVDQFAGNPDLPKQFPAGKKWGPGFRFFRCYECDTTWKDKSRDCTSSSGEACPNKNCESYLLVSPYDYETHPEWPTDPSGNLLE